jgi:alkylation response protein AidB-like acyl-CoA dehydrogenase
VRVIASPELDRFRDEARTWLHANRPRGPKPLEGWPLREYDTAWQRAQYDGGWAGIAWPRDFGGRGLSLIEQMIWWEEYSRAECPPLGSMFVAMSHAGPTLIMAGTEAQKANHLPMILKGEAIWCQGFSEPSAGSDLTSLQTRGEVDGEDLVVNGTKIWTSYGPVADWQELLIRTEPGSTGRKGLSWVICDMKAAGVTARPIKAMAGVTHFSQVFYDDVRIPLSSIVGELNQGWKTAMTTLGFERGAGTISHQIELAHIVRRLFELARGRRGEAAELLAADLAMLRAEVAALRAMTALSISRGLREAVPGAEGNIVALYYGELTRRVHQAVIDLLGAEGLERGEGREDWPLHYLESFKWAIGGGTSDIRRNAIGDRVLGLPKTGRGQ